MFTNSSINWCEEDYVHSNYIAEYWNSITGLALCLSAYICYIHNKTYNVYLLYYSNFLLLLVGIGTIMFHGTLIYFWQLLDEIPMILIVIEYYKILTIDIELAKNLNIIKINYKLMYYIIPIIIFSYYIHPLLQVGLFQGSLTIFIISILYTYYMIICNYYTYIKKRK